MKSIRCFILNYLQKEYTFPDDDIDTINYVESGYIDSLAMLKFVVELEDKFGIEFSDGELSLPDFKIVGGLIKLVELKAAKMQIPDL
jgi:acyl carrier protein